MATRVCPACNAANPGDAMFCQECGDYLVKSDRFEIEQRIERSHCARCGHYNAIEKETCEGCGYDLSQRKNAIFRDENGRLRMMREAPLTRPVQLLAGLTVLVCLLFAGRMLYYVSQHLADDMWATAKHPLGGALLAYGVVSAFILGQRTTNLDYKARAVFTLLLGGILSLKLAFGGNVEVWKGTALDTVVLWAHLAGLVYCLLFLLRAEFLRSVMTVLAFLVGLWCAYPGLLMAFSGAGYDTYLGSSYGYMGLAPLLSPGFLTFNIYLPYILLMMVSRVGHQMAATSRYVVNNPTDRAVLRRFRNRQLQGVFLDILCAGSLVGVGLWRLHQLGRWNVLTGLLQWAGKLGAG